MAGTPKHGGHESNPAVRMATVAGRFGVMEVATAHPTGELSATGGNPGSRLRIIIHIMNDVSGLAGANARVLHTPFGLREARRRPCLYHLPTSSCVKIRGTPGNASGSTVCSDIRGIPEESEGRGADKSSDTGYH